MTDKSHLPASRHQFSDELAINRVEIMCSLTCGKSQRKMKHENITRNVSLHAQSPLPVTGRQPQFRFKNSLLEWCGAEKFLSSLRDHRSQPSCCGSSRDTKWKQTLRIKWERSMGPRRNIEWLYPHNLPCVAPHWIRCRRWLTASETWSYWSMKAWTAFGYEERFC